MRHKRHNGAGVKRGGVMVHEEDYRGAYCLEIQTESGETDYYVLRDEQIERLNKLTAEPVGSCETEPTVCEWLMGLLPWRD